MTEKCGVTLSQSPCYAFGKHQRLLKPSQFQKVFDGVDTKQGGSCFTFLSRTNDNETCRLGLIISKRHLKAAVARNRVKRCIRESFRLRQKAFLAAQTKFDLIVLSKPQVCQLDKRAIKKELDQQWSRFLNKRNA